MSDKIQITVLVENSVQTRGLKAEHGLAWLIEIGGHRVLFDTGQTELLLDNARMLGCSLDNLDAIVLSHGHYDHTGGLAAICRLSPAARVFLHPAALSPKYSVASGTPARSIGMPDASRRALNRLGAAPSISEAFREVVPGLFVTGEIPRQTDFEDVGGPFFLDEQGNQPDPLLDDQALFFESSEGCAVLLGCAHAGVVNTLMHVQQLTGGKRMQAVLGGMHLGDAGELRLRQTVEFLRQTNPDLLAPAHCTGMAATTRLWSAFAGRCRSMATGTRLTFPC